MNLSMKQKQTHRHREQVCGCYGEGEVEEGWSGRLELQQLQTIIYIMDKQQVLLYGTINYIQYPMINHNERNMKKNIYMCMCVYIYVYKTESLCSTAEINTIL